MMDNRTQVIPIVSNCLTNNDPNCCDLALCHDLKTVNGTQVCYACLLKAYNSEANVKLGSAARKCQYWGASIFDSYTFANALKTEADIYDTFWTSQRTKLANRAPDIYA